MKRVIGLFVAGVVLLAQSGYAATVSYTVSATVPTSSAVSINAFSVNSTSGVRTAITGTALSFDPLIYQPSLGIYLPDHYFVVESGLTSGAGNQDITVVYTEGTNPNNPGHGLGWKTVATFNKVTGPTTEVTLSAHGKKMLKDLTAEHITAAEIGTNLLRMYVGVVTKDPAAVPLDPAASEVISNADRQGAYNGTLVVTATVV